jgi:hypothetical protein
LRTMSDQFAHALMGNAMEGNRRSNLSRSLISTSALDFCWVFRKDQNIASALLSHLCPPQSLGNSNV